MLNDMRLTGSGSSRLVVLDSMTESSKLEVHWQDREKYLRQICLD